MKKLEAKMVVYQCKDCMPGRLKPCITAVVDFSLPPTRCPVCEDGRHCGWKKTNYEITIRKGK